MQRVTVGPKFHFGPDQGINLHPGQRLPEHPYGAFPLWETTSLDADRVGLVGTGRSGCSIARQIWAAVLYDIPG